MSSQLVLRSGCNPHQTPARAWVAGPTFPLEVLNGEPGFINLLDALGSWQLVRDLAAATGEAAATSFKHVNPAGAAITAPLEAADRRAAHLDPETVLSPAAAAYSRARGGDRLSSYGDWVAVERTVDETLGQLLAGEVSDGIIAPGYTAEALELLRGKKQGGYCILAMDPDWQPAVSEQRSVFGITVEQAANTVVPGPQHLTDIMTSHRDVPEHVRRDLLVGLATVKHAVSNAVAVCHDGQLIGLAAGQQSRIDATRLACRKAERWWLRRHPAVLDLPCSQRCHASSATTRSMPTSTVDPMTSRRCSPQRPSLWVAPNGVTGSRRDPTRAWSRTARSRSGITSTARRQAGSDGSPKLADLPGTRKSPQLLRSMASL